MGSLAARLNCAENSTIDSDLRIVTHVHDSLCVACTGDDHQTAPGQPAHFEKVLYQDLRLHKNALLASMQWVTHGRDSAGQRQKCTKPPALGLLVWQEVTRHSMRSSTFEQVRVFGFSRIGASRCCCRQGTERYGKRFNLKTCLRQESIAGVLPQVCGCQVATLPLEARRGQRPGQPSKCKSFQWPAGLWASKHPERLGVHGHSPGASAFTSNNPVSNSKISLEALPWLRGRPSVALNLPRVILLQGHAKDIR